MSYVPIFKTIINSLFRKPPTTEYPFKPMPKDPLVRGSIGIDINACILCGICVKRCPVDALKTDKTTKEWGITRHGCIVCNACVEACPKKCLHMTNELTPAADTPVTEIYAQTISDA